MITYHYYNTHTQKANLWRIHPFWTLQWKMSFQYLHIHAQFIHKIHLCSLPSLYSLYAVYTPIVITYLLSVKEKQKIQALPPRQKKNEMFLRTFNSAVLWEELWQLFLKKKKNIHNQKAAVPIMSKQPFSSCIQDILSAHRHATHEFKRTTKK